MIQEFTIAGNPRGQGRPKATIRGRHAGVYESTKDKQYKTNIAAQVVTQKPQYIKNQPIILTALFYMPRPQYHFNVKGEVKERFRSVLPVTKPDLSNLIKAVEDSLNGIVWSDDSLICGYGNSGKFYTDSIPRIELRIEAGDSVIGC